MKWKSCFIGDFVNSGLADIQTGPFGTQLKASDYVSEGIPVINVRNIGYGGLRPEMLEYVGEQIAEKLAVHLLRARDIVFGRKGAVDRHLFVTNEQDNWMQGSDCIRLRIETDTICPRFISYAFLSAEHQQWMLTQSGNKATMASLNQNIIKRIKLPLPPRSIQDKVSAILSTYDDLIENNRRRIALLEESARLLYREWFVRLRFPGHEHARIVNGVPEGWKMCHIGDFVEKDLVNIQTGPFGTQLKASDYTEEGTPVINVRNIGYGDLRPDKLEYVPEDIADRLSVHLLREGDIVFGRKGAVDRHILVSSSQNGWMQGSDCIRLRSLSVDVCPVLLTFAFREPSHHEWMLTQCGNKATMASLNQGVISRIPTIVPSQIIRDEFRSFATDCLDQMTNLSLQNQKLRTARDLLLPKLLSGEIEV